MKKLLYLSILLFNGPSRANNGITQALQGIRNFGREMAQGIRETTDTVNQNIKKLKATKGCPNCLLVGANLSGINLSGANLSGANLSGAKLVTTNLSGANLTNTNFTNANLTAANVSGANFHGTILNGVSFGGTNIHKVQNFKYISVSGGVKNFLKNLSIANVTRIEHGNKECIGCYLAYANLSKKNLNEIKLNYAFLNHANLGGASLRYAVLRHASLKYANLDHADLSHADFTGADVHGTTGRNITMTGTIGIHANKSNGNISGGEAFYLGGMLT